MFDSHILHHHYIFADVLPHTYRILPNETIKSILDRSDRWRSSIKTGVLRNFAKFTGKHLCQSQWQASGLQRENFQEHLFYRTRPNDCLSHKKLDTATFSFNQANINIPFKSQSQTSSQRLMYVQLTSLVHGVYEINTNWP